MNKPGEMKSFNKSSTSIKNWAADDRPREKLLSKGATSLSDSELLAISERRSSYICLTMRCSEPGMASRLAISASRAPGR